ASLRDHVVRHGPVRAEGSQPGGDHRRSARPDPGHSQGTCPPGHTRPAQGDHRHPAREQRPEGALPRQDQRPQEEVREVPREDVPGAAQKRRRAAHRSVGRHLRHARHDQLDLPVVPPRRTAGRERPGGDALGSVPRRRPEAGRRRPMKTARAVGVAGYGAYIPRPRIAAATIASAWGRSPDARLPVREKSVPSADEDAVTMAIGAARGALARSRVSPPAIRAVWVGTESKPYAVKPSSTIVAEAIGAIPWVSAADLEFACKAGSEAMQAACAYVGSGMADHALAIGMDAAQSR